MYLKAVEVHGFKSFGEKVYIEFNQGITSIVGPNGSGKSNILDAVLWVLGEQSYKNIRAKESQDVIFSGGKDKKAMNQAEVSLIIDNQDGYFEEFPQEDLVITRKIHITGENEYFINHQKSRLKDISALFLDTGIGKSAYSVIGQGKVERIINSSPKEVKGIIEEAAGIKKFQASKNEAMKNLENVELELEKIELVLQEVRENKNRVEKQAEVAQRYLDVREEKQRVQKSILLTDYHQKQEEQEIAGKEQEGFLENCQKFDKELKETEENIHRLEEEKKNLQEKMEKISSKNESLRTFLEEQEREKVRVQERQAAFQRELEEKKERLIQEKQKREEREKNKRSFFVKKEELKKKIEDLEEKNQVFEVLLKNLDQEKKIFEETLEVKDHKLREVELQKLNVINDLETSSKRMQSSENRVKNLETDAEESQKKLEEVKKEFLIAEEKRKQQEQKLQDSEKRTQFVEEEISRLSIALNKASEKLRQLEFEEKRSSARYEAILRMEENNEGYYKGVREVLQANIPGVAGVFLELIQIPEYLERALEAAVSGNLQDIVVENSDVAKRTIQYLREKKAGKASFLPLDMLKINKKTVSQKISGVLGVAADLVASEEKYRKAVDFVLGNLLVVENYDIAIQISKANFFSGNIVTLNGELVSSRGRISGGDQNKGIASQLLERKKERKKLEEELEVLRSRMQKGNQALDEYSKQLEKYENEISNLDMMGDNLRKQKKLAEEYVESLQEKISRMEKEIRIATMELEEEIRYTKEFEKKMNSTHAQKEELIALSSTLKQEIQEIREKNKELQEKIEIQKEKFSDIRILFLNSKNHWEQLSQEEERLSKEEKEFQGMEEELERRIEILQNGKLSLEETQLELAKKIENTLEEYHKESKEMEKLHEQDKQNVEKEREFHKIQKEIESRLLFMKDKYERTEEKLERIREESILLEEELEKLTEIESEIFPFEKMRSRKENLRNLEAKLLSFGDVNLLAIEEFRELKEKYSYLGNQRDDLVRGKKVLLDLISEIKDTIYERFQEAYHIISENFNKMCMETLDNSEGKLNLLEAEEFENAGVEIFVKFKNKKRQSLSLLSGGEKSMVAIAFIMSIFMYKPSPFTFLDEIEAALDEKNTRKLIAKLKEFTSQSQFILITHNKDTMRESDSIFGVTMNKEIGISKVVPVKF